MKEKITITENGIQTYLHCKNCLSTGNIDIIAVGWTEKGIQVWCDNCDKNVIALDFLGNKVGIDIKPKINQI